jgi:protein involved in polysaccharide export with SLBB domain
MRAEIKSAVIKNIIMTLATTVALGGVVAYSQDGSSPQGAADSARAAPASPAKVPLEIGDKLKISFYETLDMAAAKQSGQNRPDPQGALRTFYQRMDLSGDYAVEQDGAISIPLLGQFQVEGRALDELRADLAVSFTSVIGRSANIDVKISDRSPIYVVGPVKNPGAYKHVPGMIVLHAVALAGGLDRGEANALSMVEGVREMERLRTISFQFKQLLARRARLEAERDGATTLPMPVQLTSLEDEGAARTFIATESTILRAEQAKRRLQDRDISLKVAAARNEVEALRRKLDQIDVQRDMRTERLNDLQKLKDRGWVTNTNVVALRSELSDVEARRQDYLVQVAQAESRLAEAEEAGPRLSAEDDANLALAIATADKEIAAAHEAMVSATALTTILHRSGGTQQPELYEIVRQSKEGPTTLRATETSPLMPGDVLKVILKAAAVVPSVVPSLSTPVPQSEPAGNRINTAYQR